jgi:hypothetical protein
MSDQAIWAMTILSAVWGLLMVWWAPRLSPTTVMHSFIGLSLALFIIAAFGPFAGVDQVPLVVGVFLIPALGTFFSAMMSRRP